MQNTTFHPLIKSYPEYAHLFSILGSPDHDECFAKWFCSNFIQLRFDTSADVDEALFFEKDVEECTIYRCSLLDKLIFNKGMFKSETEFFNMAQYYLQKGYYIIVVLNHYFLPDDKDRFHIKHQNHECLIHGIDPNNHTYYVQDFFSDRYTNCSIKAQDFWDAYINHQQYVSVFDDEKIYLFKKRKENELKKLPFQKLKIKSQFENYLIGEIGIDNRIYGIKCYEKLIENVHRNKIDFRDFFLLFEHSFANSFRIKLFNKYGLFLCANDLQEDFDLIYKNSLSMKSKILKWFITKKFYPKQLELFLHRQKQLEIEAIQKLLDKI